ncbi:lachesin-like isoform X2 [Brevipalpus obovatus]|uniref:lachesin-like isoform X2 n=1 Tax=Brevipalpus obovatus TaxID=246614 RepID=UPI003D9E5E9F
MLQWIVWSTVITVYFVHHIDAFLPPGLGPFKNIHPRFVGPIKNISVSLGKEAVLQCTVDNLGDHKIIWLREDPEVTLLTMHTSVIVGDTRLKVTNDNNKQWSLHIRNVTENDRGTYICNVNSEPQISRKVFLDILVPPFIVEEETSKANVVVDERSRLSLRCKASGYPTPTVIWRREDSRSLSIGFVGGKKLPATRVEGEYLNISQVTREDMGAYLCIASNGVPPSRSYRIFVQVNFPPKIKVPQLSVGAPKDSEVTLQCEIEGLPRPVTSWLRKSVLLSSSPKYSIDELESSYSLTMRLTIKNLEEKDFALYKCVAKNSLGEQEGIVRVHKTTPSTAFSVPFRSKATTPRPASTATVSHGSDFQRGSQTNFNSLKEVSNRRGPIHIINPPSLDNYPTNPSKNEPNSSNRCKIPESWLKKSTILQILVNFVIPWYLIGFG